MAKDTKKLEIKDGAMLAITLLSPFSKLKTSSFESKLAYFKYCKY